MFICSCLLDMSYLSLEMSKIMKHKYLCSQQISLATTVFRNHQFLVRKSKSLDDIASVKWAFGGIETTLTTSSTDVKRSSRLKMRHNILGVISYFVPAEYFMRKTNLSLFPSF